MRKKILIYPLTLFLIISKSNQINDRHCMIDQCYDCDFTNVYTCNTCKPGYYLKNFYSEEKGRIYQDCWSKLDLTWIIIGLICLSIMNCLCIYYCYRCAITEVRVPEAQETEYVDRRRQDGDSDDLVHVEKQEPVLNNQPFVIEGGYNPQDNLPTTNEINSYGRIQRNNYDGFQGYTRNGNGGILKSPKSRRSRSKKRYSKSKSNEKVRRRNSRKDHYSTSPKKYMRREKSRSRSRGRSSSRNRRR